MKNVLKLFALAAFALAAGFAAQGVAAQARVKGRDPALLESGGLKEKVPGQAALRSRVLSELETDGLPESQAKALGPDLDAYVGQGGSAEHFRDSLRATRKAGCDRACLAEAAKGLVKAKKLGLSDAKAGELVGKAVEAEKLERKTRGLSLSNGDQASRLRAKLDAALALGKPGKAKAQEQGRKAQELLREQGRRAPGPPAK